MQNNTADKPIIIGVMGTIGSGKTTVSHILESYGAYIINADIEARLLMLPSSPAAVAIHREFGDGVMLEGTDIVDRKALSQRVFSDKAELDRLNGIMYPLIRSEMHTKADIAYRIYGHKLIVFDAPLLIESGLNEGLDHIWLVSADDDVRISRIMARDRVSADAAQARISVRMPDKVLSKYATKVIENNGSYTKLCDAVREAFLSEIGDINSFADERSST